MRLGRSRVGHTGIGPFACDREVRDKEGPLDVEAGKEKVIDDRQVELLPLPRHSGPLMLSVA
jgi:hypothetical protein